MISRVVMLRVCRRIVIVVESAPEGKLNISEVSRLYFHHFNTQIDFSNWGFKTVEDFVLWCTKQESGTGPGGRIVVREVLGAQGEKFFVLKK